MPENKSAFDDWENPSAFQPQGHIGNTMPQVAAGEAMASMATGMAAKPLAGLYGLVRAPFVGADQAADDIRSAEKAMTYQPRSERAAQLLQHIGKGSQAVGQAVKYPIAKAAQLPEHKEQEFMNTPVSKYVGENLQEQGASPAVATAAETVIAGAPYVAAGVSALRAAPKAAPKVKAPSIEKLKAESTAAYKAADSAGVKIADQSVKNAYNSMIAELSKKGFRQKLHPQTAAALKDIRADIQSGGLTLTKADELRRVLQQAGGGVNAKDIAMSGNAVRAWDKFIENLGKGDIVAGDAAAGIKFLKDARNLWSRSKKAEVIEDLMERAGVGRSNFSGSGYENAIRREFIALAKNKKKMRQFNAAETIAIRRVANGGNLDNVARWIGKAAPSSWLNMAIGGGIGYAVAGPAGGVLVPMAGAIGRKVGTKMTISNANKAAELVRSGQ